jgi:tetratricopeptide (TPR) repeat protein
MRLLPLICFLPFLCLAQSRKTDSLKARLNEDLHDSARASILTRLGKITAARDLAAGVSYLKQAVSLYTELDDAGNLARVYNTLGAAYTNHALDDSALQAYSTSYRFAVAAQDTHAMSQTLLNTGTCYFMINSYNNALDYLLRGLRLAERINSERDLLKAYGMIGNVYKEQGKYKEALFYYAKSREYAIRIGQPHGLAVVYVNSGNVYYDLAKQSKNAAYLDSAYYLYTLGESTILADPDTAVLNMLYVNIANVFADKKQFSQALHLYHKALDMKMRIGEESQLALVYENVASCYLEINELGKAEEYIRLGLEAALASQSYQDMSNLYKDYAELYRLKNDYRRAFDHYVLYKQYADSVINEDNIEKRKELELNYTFDKEREQNLLEEREKEVLRKEEKKRSQIYIAITVGGLVLTIIIALIIFRNLRLMKRAHAIISQQKDEIEKQKELVEHKQKEILDSIRYAKRIQSSLLASERYIEKSLRGLKYRGPRPASS